MVLNQNWKSYKDVRIRVRLYVEDAMTNRLAPKLHQSKPPRESTLQLLTTPAHTTNHANPARPIHPLRP
jgi:hypothetical protein